MPMMTRENIVCKEVKYDEPFSLPVKCGAHEEKGRHFHSDMKRVYGITLEGDNSKSTEHIRTYLSRLFDPKVLKLVGQW